MREPVAPVRDASAESDPAPRLLRVLLLAAILLPLVPAWLAPRNSVAGLSGTPFVGLVAVITLLLLVVVVVAASSVLRGMESRQRQLRGELLEKDLRLRAEAASRESEEAFGAIFEVTNLGVAQTDTVSRRFKRVNAAFCEITGYSEEELLQLCVEDVNHPDEREQDQQRFERLVRGETASYECEKRYLRRDGGVIWVHVTGNVIHDAEGRPAGTVAIVQDVTRRRLADAQLRASEEFTRRVTAIAPSILYVYDLGQARNVWGNRELFWTLGYGVGDVALFGKRPMESIIHPEDRAVYESHRRRLLSLADGDVASLEYRIRRADGSWCWLESREMVFRRGDDGSVLQILGTAQDTTERKRWEEALRASEERFRGVYENAPTGIAITDASGNFQQCNPAYCELLGYSEEELKKMVFAELVHPDDRGINLANVPRLLSGEIPSFEIENRYIRKTGESVWVHKFVTVFHELDGKISNLVALVTDMTGRRRAEEALRLSETRARMALDELNATYASAPVGLCVLDRDLRFVRVNDCLAAINGVPVEAHIGRTVREVVPGLADRAEAIVRQILETGEPARDIEISGETASEPGRERTWRENWFPFLVGGEVTGLNVVIEEITARREAQRSFERQSNLLRTITDTATTAIFMIDTSSRLTFMNPAAEAMTGYTLSEATGRVLHDLVHYRKPDGSPYPVSECPIDRARPERVEVHDYEDLFVRKDGSFFPVLCNARPVWSDDPSLGTVIEVRDISRQKELEQQRQQALDALKEANHRKDEFLAMLAHELRNPLAPLRNATHVMRLLKDDDARVNSAREIIERQVSHMTRLVDDLLDVSRITRGKIKLRRERLAASEIIDAAVEAVRPEIKKQGQTLVLGPLEDARLKGDRVRLVQVVTNLLTNAVKFTPRGGRIEVAVTVAGKNVVFSVRDNGVGIPRDAQGRVFDLFRQEDSSLERTQGGLGIGLTIVKRLVEMHGGSVDVYSEGPGTGCEFRVTLPGLRDEAAAAAATIAGHGAGATAIPPLHVVIVEDNPDAAQSFRMLLELNDHRVEVARDGPEGIQLIVERQPDVAFIDLGLPGIDGYGVASALRARAGKQPVLVALSGYGSDEDKKHAREAGFDEHMTKPVDYERVERFLTAIPRGQ